MDFGWFLIILVVVVPLLLSWGNSDENENVQKKNSPRGSAPEPKKKPPVKTPRENVTYSHLAGFPYREFGKNKVPSSVLYVRQTLTARREKENQYDSNAIRLYSGEKWAGFIAKESNPPLAEHMDNGGQLRIEIIKINDGDIWRGIHLAVRLI